MGAPSRSPMSLSLPVTPGSILNATVADGGRVFFSVVSISTSSLRIDPHDDNPQILTAADAPREPQRSKNPYSILRSTGRLKIVVSGDLTCATSIARRLANDLFTYLKLDVDIVHETEIIEGPQSNTRALAGTGNIVVIGSPSGQYIRQCLAKERTAFTIAEKESGSPVLQLNGETLSGLSQGNLFAKHDWTGLSYI
jgi:hypothetical protein